MAKGGCLSDNIHYSLCCLVANYRSCLCCFDVKNNVNFGLEMCGVVLVYEPGETLHASKVLRSGIDKGLSISTNVSIGRPPLREGGALSEMISCRNTERGG